ncbi:DUF2848 family protein [Aneurinibacillus sp. REN35]|uniref:DUF2848 family protein n=1 Tax=Aneurinibacillus sp. REN35 TaxID=3237286 RepID=UPI0035277089
MRSLAITIETAEERSRDKEVAIKKVLVVGYGGRDIEKVKEHIEELAEIGVKPPQTIPAIYPMELAVLNTDASIAVSGKQTSGEAEYVLLHDGSEWLVTLGSDHTDRKLEAEDIQKSKEACPKPVALHFWRLSDIEKHWDQLLLRSWMTDEAGRRLYQEHDLTALLPVPELLQKLHDLGYQDLEHTMIFSGTVPTLEGFAYGSRFEMELEDPVLGRAIKAEYNIEIEEVSRA